ncbi:MAG TPA: orotidine-5'-phosphate decarboxylase [Marmoricola sp.]|jgi:orotidine-5'-phosphate decarboxylase|nr:orotidine-5'-phosphate decarboxylase [Marmoricola sp.]
MTAGQVSFGSRLRAAMDSRGPLCAGIDPHPGLLGAWDLPETIDGLRTFALSAAEALGPVCAAIKPQSAFFERFGAAGVGVLEETIRMCREAGALVVLDVKRGDIGSTAQAYADAYLDQSSTMAADAITASPYLGFGSLEPMFETARRNNAGVFVLALTSNPEGPDYQHATRPDGRTVAESVLDSLREANAGSAPLGSFGAVVGATIEVPTPRLDIDGPLLVPGIGAQGGTAEDVRRIFGDVLDLVLPSSSREILGAGPDPTALRDAAARAAAGFATLAAG